VTALIVIVMGTAWLAYLIRGPTTASADEWCRKADALYETGDYAQAEAVYNELVKLQPMHSRALFGLGRIALKRGLRPVAAEHLTQAQRANPKDAEIARTLFELLVEVGHMRPARHTLRLWLEADPGNEEALALKAGLPRADDPERARRPEFEHHRPLPPRDNERGRRHPPLRGPRSPGPPSL